MYVQTLSHFKAVAISHHIDCSMLGPKCPVQASRPWQLMPNRQSKITKHHDAKQSLSAKRVAVANFSPKFIASFCIGDRSTPSCCLHTDERSRTQPYHPPTIKQEHASHFLQSLGLHPMIQLHRTLNPPQQRHRRNTSTQALRTWWSKIQKQNEIPSNWHPERYCDAIRRWILAPNLQATSEVLPQNSTQQTHRARKTGKMIEC